MAAAICISSTKSHHMKLFFNIILRALGLLLANLGVMFILCAAPQLAPRDVPLALMGCFMFGFMPIVGGLGLAFNASKVLAD